MNGQEETIKKLLRVGTRGQVWSTGGESSSCLVCSLVFTDHSSGIESVPT
jgi:hypothetical protein